MRPVACRRERRALSFRAALREVWLGRLRAWARWFWVGAGGNGSKKARKREDKGLSASKENSGVNVVC